MVTATASASTSTPCNMRARTCTTNFTSLAYCLTLMWRQTTDPIIFGKRYIYKSQRILQERAEHSRCSSHDLNTCLQLCLRIVDHDFCFTHEYDFSSLILGLSYLSGRCRINWAVKRAINWNFYTKEHKKCPGQNKTPAIYDILLYSLFSLSCKPVNEQATFTADNVYCVCVGSWCNWGQNIRNNDENEQTLQITT